jgi:hypothetical protein
MAKRLFVVRMSYRYACLSTNQQRQWLRACGRAKLPRPSIARPAATTYYQGKKSLCLCVCVCFFFFLSLSLVAVSGRPGWARLVLGTWQAPGEYLHIRVHLWWEVGSGDLDLDGAVGCWSLVVTGDWSPVSSNKARGYCCRTSCRPPSPMPHCSRGVQPGGIYAHVVHREPTPGGPGDHRGRAGAGAATRHLN